MVEILSELQNTIYNCECDVHWYKEGGVPQFGSYGAVSTKADVVACFYSRLFLISNFVWCL